MFKNPSLKQSEVKQSKASESHLVTRENYRTSPLGTLFWAHGGEESVWE